ncbi:MULTISPECIES: PaaI family thioesterase [Brevibacterium]|uniref:Acyl-coenzyme A thioesterase THEM4 n=1 Tax=Brevibacterium salitolerans TaxID=1403566 RepID=A0ABP5I390_9MICO|nr:PaaI family thioesterase [Brevibacterium sp.]
MSVSPFAEHTTRLTRSLINALVSEHDDAALASRVREIAADLSAAAEDPSVVEIRDPMRPRSRFRLDLTPASSARNPIAPPLEIRHRVRGAAEDDGTAESYADVVLPLQYQGPPGRVHGGIVALMLDQVLGDAAHASGLPPAFTRELTLTYDAGTPLNSTVRVSGRISRIEGRKRFMEGEITADGVVTARARGLWISPREQSAPASSRS